MFNIPKSILDKIDWTETKYNNLLELKEHFKNAEYSKRIIGNITKQCLYTEEDYYTEFLYNGKVILVVIPTDYYGEEEYCILDKYIILHILDTVCYINIDNGNIQYLLFKKINF